MVLDNIGDDTLSCNLEVLAQLGHVVSIVDLVQPQNLLQAWDQNANYHFALARQNRGKLDEPGALVERDRLRSHVSVAYSLADTPPVHARPRSYDNGIREKIAIVAEPSADPAQVFAR